MNSTAVRAGDPRVAGHYEQVSRPTSSRANYRFLAPQLAGVVGLDCSGLMGLQGRLDYDALVDLARVGSDDRFGVALLDLLSAVHLDRSAEIIVFDDVAGSQTAVPVRDMLRDSGAFLTIGSHRRPMLLTDGLPLRLDLAGWTSEHEVIAPISMHALTFTEFIGCP